MNEGPKKVEVVITTKEKINHDCYIYKLAYTNQTIDFNIGQFFKFIVNIPTYDHP